VTPTATPTSTPTATPTPGEEICRTPGFWGTHAGNEKGAPNLTELALAGCQDCLEVCGEVIRDTSLNSADSAVEALCVAPGQAEGNRRLTLARHLVAATLNCSLTGPCDCSSSSIATIYAACNDACAGGSTSASVEGETVDCVEAIDCFNNGGTFDAESGFCQTGSCEETGAPCNEKTDCVCVPTPGNCQDRDLPESICSGGCPASSSNKCNQATQNSCTVVGLNELLCASGTKSIVPEECN
jgi:hypothetical protein